MSNAEGEGVNDVSSAIGLSIRELRELVRPTLEEITDEFFHGRHGRSVFVGMLEDARREELSYSSARMEALFDAHMKTYFSSKDFQNQVELALALRPVLNEDRPVQLVVRRKRKSRTLRSSSRTGTGSSDTDVGENGTSDARCSLEEDLLAGSIFVKIRLQCEDYTLRAGTDKERFHILCQAYSVVKAKCRRSLRIKNKIQVLVLDFINSAQPMQRMLSEQEIDVIRGSVYDGSSGFKISLA